MNTDQHRSSPSTGKQRQLIAIGCSQVGISATLRHEMLAARFGVDSSTKLTRIQAALFLSELEARGFTIRSRKGTKRSRKGRIGTTRKPGATLVAIASQGELDKIRALAGLIRWKCENGLERWMQKRFGIDRVRTSHDAFRVIEGLKKMFENRMKRDFGDDWWVRVFDDPAIEIYKTEHCPERYILPMMKARYDALQMKDCPKGRRAE